MTTISKTPYYAPAFSYLQPFFAELGKGLDISNGAGYPVHDIIATSDNDYRITLAVPGFAENELSIELKEQELTISGTHTETEAANQEHDQVRYLVRGIESSNFKRTFRLPDNFQVIGAELKNGMLSVALHREIPEAQKPQRIAIKTQNSSEVLEQQTTSAN